MFCLLSIIFFSIQQIACNPKLPLYYIQKPVSDLRFQPESAPKSLTLPTCDVTNAGQITQLLFGELVQIYHTIINDHLQQWSWVHALQQESYDADKWHGYPGWILTDDLQPVETLSPTTLIVKSMHAKIFDITKQFIQTFSIGSRLIATKISDEWWQFKLNEHEYGYIHNHDVYCLNANVFETEITLRTNIVNKAQEFLGNLYSWGGRSAQDSSRIVSSVDCSALVNLCYLSQGLQIPRMSHEQFLRSNKIECCKDLQPGDLIFFVSITKQSARMDHVMMFLGNDQILESTYADDHKVRIVSFQERFGQSCNIMMDNNVVEWRNEQFHVFFGSFLNDSELIQKLRDDVLKFEY